MGESVKGPPSVFSPGAKPSMSRIVEGFHFERPAGAGGMSTVWRATDRRTGQTVAVKVLQRTEVTDMARFHQEAALLAELRHPNIVRYIDRGVAADGNPYIVMEWLEGETLAERLDTSTLSAQGMAHLAARVLEALAAAHGRGVIHRDVKPSNIFLVGWRSDDIRVLDFGVARRLQAKARFTKAGATVGTPFYAAPEQARGERNLDGRADIFSLGCVLYECVSGEPPWVGKTPMEVMAKVCMGPPRRVADRCPGLPAALVRLVDSMLIQDRNKRPGDAVGLAASFAAIAGNLRSEPGLPTVRKRSRPGSSR